MYDRNFNPNEKRSIGLYSYKDTILLFFSYFSNRSSQGKRFKIYQLAKMFDKIPALTLDMDLIQSLLAIKNSLSSLILCKIFSHYAYLLWSDTFKGRYFELQMVQSFLHFGIYSYGLTYCYHKRYIRRALDRQYLWEGWVLRSLPALCAGAGWSPSSLAPRPLSALLPSPELDDCRSPSWLIDSNHCWGLKKKKREKSLLAFI